MQPQIEKLKNAAFDPKVSLGNSGGIRGAIGLAVEVEKSAIRIYTGVRDTFVERFHSILDNIINEEKKHLEMLMKIREKLEKR